MVAESNEVAIPVIPNIHQRILEEVTADPKHFDMTTWHQGCGTTHCRAGWVTTLAGEEDKKLEEFHNTELAASLIYKASCPEVPVYFPRFYETNAIALADIKRCAAEEAKLAK